MRSVRLTTCNGFGSQFTRRADRESIRVHITNVVTFAGSSGSPPVKYSSDIAFGGDGPTLPLALNADLVHRNLGPQEVRLVRDWLAEQTWRPSGEEGERHKYWIYQYRNGPQNPWNSFYCFLEMEFTQTDWERVSLFTASPTFMHAQQMIIVKFLGRKNESTGEMEVYGKRMLVDGTIKENLGGKTEVVLECRTETERADALRTLFDINLTQDELAGIVGYRTELQG